MKDCGKDRYYQYGCYAVLVNLVCCGRDPVTGNEIISKATVINDQGGVFTAGTDVTGEITDMSLWKPIDADVLAQMTIEQAVEASGSYTVTAPFDEVVIRDTSTPATDLVINGLVVPSANNSPAEKSYGVDQPGEYTSDLTITGGNFQVQVVRRRVLPCLKDDSVRGYVGLATLVDMSANDSLCPDEGKTYTISNEVNCAVVNHGDGTATVTPDPAACGANASYQYTVDCAGGVTETATVTIEVPDNLVRYQLAHVTNDAQFDLTRFYSSDGGDVTFYWGDGSSDTVPQNTAFSHPYSPNFQGWIDIEYTSCRTLTKLELQNNDIDMLDVTQNPALTTLHIAINQLTALDVTQNPALETLFAYNNQLTALDVTQNPALVTLYAYNNQLTALDVTQNPALTTLATHTNQLTALDVTQNPALTTLHIAINQLTALDVTQNPALETLFAYNNQLTQAAVDQAFITLDSNGIINGRVDLRGTGMAAPSAAGAAAVASLISKGWTDRNGGTSLSN